MDRSLETDRHCEWYKERILFCQRGAELDRSKQENPHQSHAKVAQTSSVLIGKYQETYY